MKSLSISQLAIRFSAVAVLVCLCTSFGQTQDPKEDPEYGTKNQCRTDEANHQRAQTELARDERHRYAKRENGQTIQQRAAAR